MSLRSLRIVPTLSFPITPIIPIIPIIPIGPTFPTLNKALCNIKLQSALFNRIVFYQQSVSHRA